MERKNSEVHSKANKMGGSDGLVRELLKYGGSVLFGAFIWSSVAEGGCA